MAALALLSNRVSGAFNDLYISVLDVAGRSGHEILRPAPAGRL